MSRLLLALISLLVSANIVFAKDQYIANIIATYDANQARFHVQHKNQDIKGPGIVTEITTDPLGTGFMFYVSLNVNGSEVKCATKDKNVAASLDKGQRVNFEGKIRDVVFGTLHVEECRFERTTITEDMQRNEYETPNKIGDMLPWGGRDGGWVTITSISGQNSRASHIGLEYTKENQRDRCLSVENDTSPNCIKEDMASVRKSIKNELRGDCESGIFTDAYGDRYQFRGKNKNGDPKYMFVDLTDNRVLDGTHASGYSTVEPQFFALCNKRAN